VPGSVLILPGFHGKLPQAGDFVSRRLPADLVRFWDRWVARHLVSRLAGPCPLHFALALGPLRATGLVLASADRAGRRFPLTLAAPGAAAADPAWRSALAALGAAAVGGELTADALDARLRALPIPAAEASGAALTLWTDASAARSVDPDRPEPDLAALLAAPAEAR